MGSQRWVSVHKQAARTRPAARRCTTPLPVCFLLLFQAVAFSRDQPNKVYVQHKIRQDAERVWAMLQQQGAVVYVSGSANKMPADVAQVRQAPRLHLDT